MIDHHPRQQPDPQGLLRDLASLDRVLYEAVTVTSTPALDSALRAGCPPRPITPRSLS